VKQSREDDHRQGNRDRNQKHCSQQKQQVKTTLPARFGEMVFQNLVIAQVRFEDDVEEVADEGKRAGQTFNRDVDHHTRDSDSRHAELDCAIYDVERHEAVDDVADSGNQADNSREAEAKAARQYESIIKPTRDGFDIGDSGIDYFATAKVVFVNYERISHNSSAYLHSGCLFRPSGMFNPRKIARASRYPLRAHKKRGRPEDPRPLE
jgi:hypothetical protein